MANHCHAARQPAFGRLFAFGEASRSRGFTLLEVMVVVVIIGIMLTVSTLSMRGDSHAELMQREARRLIVLLDLASQEALMRSEQIAVRFNDRSYEFMRLQNGRWVSQKDDPSLRLRKLPDNIELRLELEDNPPPSLVSEESDLPQVYLLSSGEMTPFVVTLFSSSTEQRFVITGSLMGNLVLEK